MKKLYKLYLYDVWGNTRDGFEVNDIHAALITLDGTIFNTENVIIPIKETDSDYSINRKLKCRGVEWESLESDEYYGRLKSNGKPFGELRPIEESI
jgi:hypothetical protein